MRHYSGKILRQLFRGRLNLSSALFRQIRICPSSGKMLRMVRCFSMSYKNDHIRIPYSPPASDQQFEIQF